MRIMLAALLLLAVVQGQAAAQNRAYTQGPVIEVSYVRVKPGMFDKYMQWLATDWKRNLEAQKKEDVRKEEADRRLAEWAAQNL